MKRLSLISRLRTQKLLGKTVLILLTLALAVVVGSYFLIRGQIVSRYQEQSWESTLSMLQRTSAATDWTVQALEAQIQSLWQNEDISSLLVAPERPDFARTSGAVGQLQRFREENGLVQRCFLYLYHSEQLMTDRQQLMDRENPAAPERLEELIQAAGGQPFTLWCADGEVYLLVTFPEPKKLGLFIAQLDARALFEQVQTGGASLLGDTVYVYDAAAQPVFPNRTSYPERDLLMTAQQAPREGVYPLAGQGDVQLCVTRSTYSGWHYLAYLSSRDWLPSAGEVFTAFLPAALALCLLILLMAVVILQTVYRPIQKIVQSMVAGQETGPGQDEAGLISAALASRQEENQRLAGLLSDVRPALTERFFQSVLAGARTDPADLAETLATLDSPFPLEGTYLVLAGESAPERPASAVEREIYTRSLRQSTARFWEERCLVHAQLAPDGRMAAVLCFLQPPHAKLPLLLEDYRRTLAQATSEFPFTPVVGASQPKPGLEKVAEGWQEARQDLSYQKYCQTGGGGDKGRPDPTGFYDSQVQSAVQLALSGELGQARAQLEDLRRTAGEAEQQTAVLSMLRSRFLTEVLRVQRELGEDYSAHSAPDSPNFWGELDGLLVRLEEWGRNSQRVYMDRAMDYITAHFSDSNLSLNEVSSHVGLSVSYLSTLFSKYQAPGFSHYLRQYRIEQARLLLQSTDASVTEIGYRTGFNSSNSFIRTFKSLVGETPGRYREGHRGAGQ